MTDRERTIGIMAAILATRSLPSASSSANGFNAIPAETLANYAKQARQLLTAVENVEADAREASARGGGVMRVKTEEE